MNGLGIVGPSFENRGLLIVTGGSVLDVGAAAGLTQTTANAVTTVNGVLRASTLVPQAGQRKGSGTVMANVVNAGGTISAGDSPGTLSIAGNLSLGANSLMLVAGAGLAQGIQYDWLQVSGDVLLGGDLRLDFGNHAPQLGEHYSFLTSTGGQISRMFNTAYANGYVLTMDYGMQGVTATVSAITAVPEPSTYGLMLLGLGWLGAHLRRRPVRA